MNRAYIDDLRTTCLCDVGRPEYIAATCISADGAETLVLVELAALGDDRVSYDPTCPAAAHEQLGALPSGFVRRLAISTRTHRCGRRTKAGTPCQIPVQHRGDACSWHRSSSEPAREGTR